MNVPNAEYNFIISLIRRSGFKNEPATLENHSGSHTEFNPTVRLPAFANSGCLVAQINSLGFHCPVALGVVFKAEDGKRKN